MNQTFDKDCHFMQCAFELAQKALSLGEVPVGAVLVRDDIIVGEGWNSPISGHDPSAHAEVMAIRSASALLKNYRLPKTVLYVTIEPCAMCLGALVHARVSRIVYGASEPKAGCLGSNPEFIQTAKFNHTFDVNSGVLGEQSRELISGFFRQRRQEHKACKHAQSGVLDDSSA